MNHLLEQANKVLLKHFEWFTSNLFAGDLQIYGESFHNALKIGYLFLPNHNPASMQELFVKVK